jgi:beta-mannosidase
MKSKAPHIAYHPGSPWGDGLKTSNPRVGDMHQWNGNTFFNQEIFLWKYLTPSIIVWHGTQEKYQIFDSLGGRFNSEFGMEAFPHIETIKAYCNDKTQLYPQSHVLDFHNKADGHERRLATYVVENFRTLTDLEVLLHINPLLGNDSDISQGPYPPYAACSG